MACGTPLDARPTVGQERRLVTVLFADIAGFAARFEHADPEDIGAALRSFHEQLRREIESFGGTVDKFAGDVVFGVFGAPTTHEDDAERALRAGLSILQHVREQDPADPARELGVRIGIATGEAVVSVGDGPRVGERVTGDVVNVASRLQTTAMPDSIVVAESTFLGTRSQFRWQEMASITVKGKADPVRIWRPIEPLARVGVEPPDPLGAPFTGREGELDDLRRSFEGTRTDGLLQMVSIIGEAGLGKSRLIAELSRYTEALPDLIRWRVGRPSAYGQVATFGPLADIVKAEAGVLDSDEPEVALSKLDLVLARVIVDPAERARTQSHLAALLVGTDDLGEVSLDEAFSAWAGFLEAMAAEAPTVLVLEDMHDAVDPLLGFLERLLERDRPVPLLVVVAARPQLLERYPGWGIGPSASVLRLNPLTRDETTRLVRALLGSQPLAVDTRDAVIVRAAGNPLYAEEFIRMMRERIEDVGPAGGLVGRAMPESMAVPPTIHALLASRLDALPADLRATVQDAAVVGSTVWAGAVAEAGGRPTSQVSLQLEALVDRQLLRQARASSVQDQGEFSFRHVLVREVAYGQIPRADRARKHAAVGSWLDRTLSPGAADRDERLAFHYAESWELATAAGANDVAARVQEPAIDHLLAAGARAARLDAPRAHISYARALRSMPPDHPRRPTALRGAGVAAQVVGAFQEAETDLREAVVAFESVGDTAGAADARVLLARSLFERGQLEPVMPLLHEALEQLETLPRGPEFAHAATRVAGHLWVMGDHEGCIRWANEAMALSESLDLPAQRVLALQYRGASRSKLGDLGGLEDLREALRIGRDRGLGEETAIAYNNHAYELWFHRGAWASLEAWEEMLAFCEERGLATSAAWARSGMLEPLFDVGAWDRVLSMAATVRAWDADHGGRSQPGTVATTLQGWVALRRGDDAGAASASEQALTRADQLGTPEYRAPAHVLAAEVAWARGDRDGALSLVDRFLIETSSQPIYRIIALPTVARLVSAAGVEAPDLGVSGSDLDEAASSERLALSLQTARAELAEGRGDAAGAYERFQDAVRRWDRFGFPVETAQCSFGAGRCARALGREDETQRWFSDARSTFEALGARPWREELDRLSGEVTSGPQR